MTKARTDIAILGSFERYGGVGRLLVNQIRVWSAQGLRVELIGYRNPVMFYPDEMPDGVRFTDLGTAGKWPTVIRLWAYLRRTKPRVALATSHVSNLILARCRRLPGIRTRCYLGVHHTLVGNARPNDPRHQSRRLRQARREYRNADGIVAVSPALATELADGLGIDRVRVAAIFNGVVTRELFELSREPVDHPWLTDPKVRVVLSAGHLSSAKDHATLLEAFARVLREVDCRLIIIGEGTERPNLERLAGDLGIAEYVDLPGFMDNPYAWMAKADLFVLPSRSEGMSNVLAEAMSLGLPIVSTDCPTGPRDVLADGRYGDLVPVGDASAMASAMKQALQAGSRREIPNEAVAPFTAEYAARAYAEFFGLA